MILITDNKFYRKDKELDYFIDEVNKYTYLSVNKKAYKHIRFKFNTENGEIHYFKADWTGTFFSDYQYITSEKLLERIKQWYEYKEQEAFDKMLMRSNIFQNIYNKIIDKKQLKELKKDEILDSLINEHKEIVQDVLNIDLKNYKIEFTLIIYDNVEVGLPKPIQLIFRKDNTLITWQYVRSDKDEL